ncbi:hypothetical protein D9611_004934 [Ephemerocybe angulata]|uniref:lytic cellulose monooxygenase (C4-dehydrogenating) n=1 Tax=Ephemerocybe angulata TaxID=980116 RepID=A0A8H5B2P2_9AGAR|nr:hypothetical protein D9611_004934 [Tulosesus angulatus]
MKHSILWKISSAVFLVAERVSAHGWVQEITLGSTAHTGYLPYSDPKQVPQPKRIVRQIPGDYYVEDVTSMRTQCNGKSNEVGAPPAPLYGTIQAGETIKFNWTNGVGTHGPGTIWVENHVGPILTYMARVPDDIDVTNWEPGKEAVWFKIDHVGRNETTYEWPGIDSLFKTGFTTARVPPNLKPGQYLIRHEIISLHIYPLCVQVEVTGTGTAFPASFVSFPGAYAPEDSGITCNIYPWDPKELPSGLDTARVSKHCGPPGPEVIRNETIRLSSAADVNSQQNCQPTPARQRTKQYDGVYARAGQGGGRTASNGPDAQQRGSWDAPQRVKGRCTAIFSTVLYLVWMDGHVPECVAGPAAQCQFAIANVYQG